MYKAIKDNKIISVSEKKEFICHAEDGDVIHEIKGEELFPCMNFDEVVEDIEHSVEDYEHYNGEFLLKADIPLPTIEEQNEAIRQTRQKLFTEQADPLKYDYEECLARYGEEDERTIEAKKVWLGKKDEIRNNNPYISEPTETKTSEFY